MSDAQELRVQVRRWFVETGWTDGNGIGLWDHTDESVEVTSKAEAEALRDEWLSQGKIELDRWNQWKRVGSYGAFRIRSVWEDATPAALAASPEVAKLIREAKARGMERAAELSWQVAGRCETQAKNFAAMEDRERQFWEWTARSLCASDLSSAIRAEAAALRGKETT